MPDFYDFSLYLHIFLLKTCMKNVGFQAWVAGWALLFFARGRSRKKLLTEKTRNVLHCWFVIDSNNIRELFLL